MLLLDLPFETTVININKKLKDKKEDFSLELETITKNEFLELKITIGNKNLMEGFEVFQLDWITLCPDISECVCEGDSG